MPILLITSLILVLALNRHMRHPLVTSLVLLLVLTGCGTTRDPGASQDRYRQTSAIEATFHEIDTNGDGKLTLDEFGSDFLSLSRRGQSPAEVFARVDVDGDGFLTIEEFGAARLSR